MREKIDEEVSVIMYYSARKRVGLPHIVSWQNKEYHVKNIGYPHKIREGQIQFHIFELEVKEEPLWMRLKFNSDNLHWTLEAVSDGLAY